MIRALLLVIALLVAPVGQAWAAKSFDGCTGYVTALPVRLATPGTWCLKQDLTSSGVQDSVVEIAADGVTLDCKDFGLTGGGNSYSIGVNADGYSQLVVRNCRLSGFFAAMIISNRTGAQVRGIQVENNRLTHNSRGIYVFGQGDIRGNIIMDTGGWEPSMQDLSFGILAMGAVDVIDNTIAGVRSLAPNAAEGIIASWNAGSITANRIRGVVANDESGHGTTHYSAGIVGLAGSVVRDNVLSTQVAQESIGIRCDDTSSALVGNVINGYAVATRGCKPGRGQDVAAP